MRIHIHPVNPRRRGSVAVAVLVLVLILASVVGSALVGTSSSAAMSRGALRCVQALCAAESGVNRTLWEVASGGEAWIGWTSLSGGAKQYVGTVHDADGNVLAAYTTQITDPTQPTSTISSVGSRETGYDASLINREVRVTIERSGGGAGWFQWGVYASTGINMRNKAVIDSYDSSRGSYWATRGSDVQVAVNSIRPGAITVDHQGVIKGDAYIGLEGDPESGITGNVTGTKNALTSGDAPPVVEAPADITHNIGAVNMQNNDAITISQDTVCDSVLMKNDAVINVSGDVRLYILGDFEARNDVRIKIPAGSSLTIYVGGSFVMKNDAVVNWTTRVPEQCIIYGLETCDEIAMRNDTLVYAAVYAPRAKFTSRNLAALYGAMVVSEADIRNQGALHFDKAVSNLAPDTLPAGGGGETGGDGLWSIRSWRITR